MQFLLDNITATLIVGLLLLTLVALQQRGQQAAISSTIEYSVKAQAQSFVEMMEGDLRNMASGVKGSTPAGEDPRERFTCLLEAVEGPTAAAGDDTTKGFTFSTFNDDTDQVIDVQYRLLRVPGRTVPINEEERPLYRIERRVDRDRMEGDASPWELDPQGASGPIVTDFQVELQESGKPPLKGGTPAKDFSDKEISQVQISLRAARAPADGDDRSGGVHTAHFGTIVLPLAVSRLDE